MSLLGVGLGGTSIDGKLKLYLRLRKAVLTEKEGKMENVQLLFPLLNRGVGNYFLKC